MKQLSCKALGVDCDYIATGETDQEVINNMQEHAKNDHPDKWAEMNQMSDEEKDAMILDMQDKIQETNESIA